MKEIDRGKMEGRKRRALEIEALRIKQEKREHLLRMAAERRLAILSIKSHKTK